MVIIEFAPISERYWQPGDEATINNNKIRLGGCWFNFDNRFKIRSINSNIIEKLQKIEQIDDLKRRLELLSSFIDKYLDLYEKTDQTENETENEIIEYIKNSKILNRDVYLLTYQTYLENEEEDDFYDDSCNKDSFQISDDEKKVIMEFCDEGEKFYERTHKIDI